MPEKPMPKVTLRLCRRGDTKAVHKLQRLLTSSRSASCLAVQRPNKKTGEITYTHQMLGRAIVHPEQQAVMPLAPEPIIRQDGESKNDCERHAAKRFLEKLRQDYPRLPFIIVEDALSAHAPHSAELKRHKLRFSLGVKPGDHKYLFDDVAQAQAAGQTTAVELQKERVTHRFCFAFELLRGGRARWKIENETFNPLKNQDYHFEPNFGQGHNHLSVAWQSKTGCF